MPAFRKETAFRDGVAIAADPSWWIFILSRRDLLPSGEIDNSEIKGSCLSPSLAWRKLLLTVLVHQVVDATKRRDDFRCPRFDDFFGRKFVCIGIHRPDLGAWRAQNSNLNINLYITEDHQFHRAVMPLTNRAVEQKGKTMISKRKSRRYVVSRFCWLRMGVEAQKESIPSPIHHYIKGSAAVCRFVYNGDYS